MCCSIQFHNPQEYRDSRLDVFVCRRQSNALSSQIQGCISRYRTFGQSGSKRQLLLPIFICIQAPICRRHAKLRRIVKLLLSRLQRCKSHLLPAACSCPQLPAPGRARSSAKAAATRRLPLSACTCLAPLICYRKTVHGLGVGVVTRI